ncbi:unnamed protein product [Ilex paraguariensis]|uniref:Uncharacterized protein n=1 Tax=Ilex paraguariensis TaxID=185542 RepID=A0ABC8SDZ0_9AQUA
MWHFSSVTTRNRLTISVNLKIASWKVARCEPIALSSLENGSISGDLGLLWRLHRSQHLDLAGKVKVRVLGRRGWSDFRGRNSLVADGRKQPWCTDPNVEGDRFQKKRAHGS